MESTKHDGRHVLCQGGGGNAQRLSKLDVAADVKAATFHSAALHQLRQVWPDVCEGPMPFICRNPRELVERSLRRVTTFQVDDDTIRNLQAEINWCKISLIAPEDYARVCAATHRQPPSGLEPGQFVDVYKAYEAEKTNRNEIDFDDILLIVCHLMESDEDVASAIRSNIACSPSTNIRTFRRCNTACSPDGSA